MKLNLTQFAWIRAFHYLLEAKAGTFPAFDLPTLTRLVVADIDQTVNLLRSSSTSKEERAEIAMVCDRALNEGW